MRIPMDYRTHDLFLRFVTEDDLAEVARTWPADHQPIFESEARDEIFRMQRDHARNTDGSICHLCLAVCWINQPRIIIGWCGLDGRKSQTEPEIFVLLDEARRNKGYGTQCVRELLRIAAADYGLHSVHGGCGKDNIASQRAMEKGGMVQYGTEENGDPLYRFSVPPVHVCGSRNHRAFLAAPPQPGEIILFGNYPQNSDAPKPIEWVVLENDGRIIRMISRYALDARCYNWERRKVTWASCTLRKWLNEGFLEAAFTEEERKRLKTMELVSEPDTRYAPPRLYRPTYDKVYLLSRPEAERYFKSEALRVCFATAYAKAQGAWDTCCWWLRSTGTPREGASVVDANGAFRGNPVDSGYGWVRPVIALRG